MSQESDASFFSDLMYLFKIVRDVGMIPIKVIIGFFNFIRWCQNFHDTARNRIREFNARIKKALIQIEEYRKQAIIKNAPQPVLLALIRIRRYFTRLNRHGEEFVLILDEFERIKHLEYNDSNKHEFSKLKNRIRYLKNESRKKSWLKKLNSMYSVLEQKTGRGVRVHTVSKLQKNLMDVQTNIVRKRNSIPDQKVKPSINEQLFDEKYKVAQIVRKDVDNDDVHRLPDLLKNYKRAEE